MPQAAKIDNSQQVYVVHNQYTCLALWKHHVNLLLQSFLSKLNKYIVFTMQTYKKPIHIQSSNKDIQIAHDQRRQSWGGWGGGGETSPQFLDWGGRISNCPPPPHFFICSMKFNSTLFSVYCGHCLSLSILLNIIHIQTRSHMFTQSCFFSQFSAITLLIDY